MIGQVARLVHGAWPSFGSFATEAIRQQIPGMSGYDPKAEVKSGY
jgi:hypothetical protein